MCSSWEIRFFSFEVLHVQFMREKILFIRRLTCAVHEREDSFYSKSYMCSSWETRFFSFEVLYVQFIERRFFSFKVLCVQFMREKILFIQRLTCAVHEREDSFHSKSYMCSSWETRFFLFKVLCVQFMRGKILFIQRLICKVHRR